VHRSFSDRLSLDPAKTATTTYSRSGYIRVRRKTMATKSFKSWDTPASGNWGGKIPKSSAYSTRISNWRDLDWAALAENCDSAFQIAKAEVESALEDAYNEKVEALERRYASLNPEGGSYEGNASDEVPYPVLNMYQVVDIKQKATSDILEAFCANNGLKNTGTQLMALLVTYFSSFKLSTVEGEDYNHIVAEAAYKAGTKDGLISAKAFYKQLYATAEGRGLLYFIMYDNKSHYLEKQYMGPGKNFCALVPLVMYAFKLVKGIPYRHWYRKEIIGIVNPKLAMAMLWDEKLDPKPSVEAIIHAREEGLKVKTGPKAGTVRNPVSTVKLYGNSCISHLPEYVQTMYAQIWCAHPENRTKYMILDPSNWDTMPDALISSEVVETKPKATGLNFNKSTELPW